MVKIRLRRTGRNNTASFRVVATDERSPRDGKFLEILGWYDPKQEGENFKLDMDRVAFWQSKGAQLSDTVASMVKKAKKSVAAAPAVQA
jgi:small subunit ribosomal protein S16